MRTSVGKPPPPMSATTTTSKLGRPSLGVPPGGSRLRSPSPTPPPPGARDFMAVGKSARSVGLTPSAAENYAAELLNHMPSPPQSSDYPSSSATDELRIGDRVLVAGIKPGIIAFIGEVHFGEGEWAGVVLDTATGKNDGSVAGRRYFQCEPKRGIFSRLEKLTRLAGFSSTSVGAIRNSQIYSSPNLRSLDKSNGSTPSAGKSSGNQNSLTRATTASDRLSSPKNAGSVTSRRSSVDSQHSVTNLRSSQGSLTDTTSPAVGSDAFVGGLHIGDRVRVSGCKPGTLRYVGLTDFAAGLWAGVELDEPSGKNDGCVAGTRYFRCEPMFGLFTPVHKLAVLADDAAHGQLSVSAPLPASQSPAAAAPPCPATPTSARHERAISRSQMQGNPVRMKECSPSTNAMDDARRADVKKSASHLDGIGNGAPAVENGNVTAENEEICRRLKSYIEKLESDKLQLSNQLHDELRRNEDLQFSIEESAIEKSDLEAQLEKELKQRQELQERLSKETQLTDRLSRDAAVASKGKSSGGDAPTVVITDESVEEYLDQIEELTHKLSVAENKLKSGQLGSTMNVSGLCEKCQKLINSAATKGATASSPAAAAGADNTSGLRSELERLRTEQRNTEKQLFQLKDEIERSQREKEHAEQQRALLVSQRDAASVERDQVVAENNLLHRKLQEAEKLMKDLAQKAEQMESVHVAQTTDLRKRLESMQAETEKLLLTQQQLLPYRQQVEQMASTVDTLSSEREALRVKLAELQATINSHQQMESQHAASQAQINEMKTKFVQMSKDVEVEKVKLLEIVETTKRAVQLKEREIERLKAELQQVREESRTGGSQSQDAALLQQRVAQLEDQLRTNVQKLEEKENTLAKLHEEKLATEEQVQFLNAVIVEIQKKNVELDSARRQSLANGPVNGHLAAATSRLFCDICNVHDLHDTEDCPQQEMSVSSACEDQSSDDPTY